MDSSLFDKYEIKRHAEEIEITLFCKSASPKFLEEFGIEFDWKNKFSRKDIKDVAEAFVNRSFPKIKAATIVIVAGAVILATIPFNSAKAHQSNFNMTYLYFGNTTSYIRQIDQTQGNLNVVSPSYFDINADGSLNISKQFDPIFLSEMKKRGIKVVPFLSNHWDSNIGRAALENRENLTSQIAAFIVEHDLYGVQVDIENVTDIDRDNYTDLIKLLNDKLPPEKEVSVAVAANPNNWKKGWHGSYDYPELAKYADYLMIMAYDESFPGSAEGPVASYPWVERSIQYALAQKVPSEKIVLGVPFYGRYWKVGTSYGGNGISNLRVDEMLKKYGGTVSFDEVTKSPRATINIKEGDAPFEFSGTRLGPGQYQIWFENHDSIKAKLTLVHKYNLKGTGSWSLGQENPSIWQNYRTWISHDGEITVTPAQPAKPTEQTNGSTNPVTTVPKVTAPVTKPAVKPSVPASKTPPKPAPPPSLVGKFMSPKLNNTYVRRAATSNEKILKKLTVKDSVKVIQEYTDRNKVKWVRIQSGTTVGWVMTSQLVVKTPPVVAKSYPTLKYGSKGTSVVQLQDKLRKANVYKGKSHGTYDTATRTAVINFQKKYKLKADGIAGNLTHAKLNVVLGIK
ncbi:glycosyl hydrolase family 18 protein [Bacillus sp. UNCCL13]|uniref:glycosyl hydrolase family 18 protein n=1 Tax=Bacillus sp. UNCCL13 TaxID=1502772 RepID=UPI0008F001AC|nr:glycosyl hydrolase family 18 protein [Bacillus sp. UNCCL13]SFA70729.1 Spore germination protein YaaH [Bacillus sp. UNCCL13]